LNTGHAKLVAGATGGKIAFLPNSRVKVRVSAADQEKATDYATVFAVMLRTFVRGER
jgi:hypothetical protein